MSQRYSLAQRVLHRCWGGGGVLLTLGDVMATQRYLNGEQQAAGGGLPGSSVLCVLTLVKRR